MKVASRIYSGFAVVLVILLALAALNYRALLQSAQWIAETVQANRAASAVVGIERDASRLRNLLLTAAYGAETISQSQIRALHERVTARLEQLAQSPELSGHERRIVMRMDQLFSRYWEDMARLQQLSRTRRRLLEQDIEGLESSMRAQLNALVRQSADSGSAVAAAAAGEVKEHLMLTLRALYGFSSNPGAGNLELARQRLTEVEVAGDEMVERMRGTPLFDAARTVEEKLPQLRGLFVRLVAASEQFQDLFTNRMDEAITEIGYLAEQLNEETDRTMEQLAEASRDEMAQTAGASIALALIAGALAALLAATTARRVTRPLGAMTDTIVRVTRGEHEAPIPAIDSRDEFGDLARAANDIRQLMARTEQERWIKSALTDLAQRLQDSTNVEELASQTLRLLAPLMKLPHGAYYAYDEDERLVLAGGIGIGGGQPRPSFALGEGLVGECARERRPAFVDAVPQEHLRVRSGLIEGTPLYLALIPVVHRRILYGVLELADYRPFPESHRLLLTEAVPLVAQQQEGLLRHRRTSELLEQTQRQAEELQASEEEMRTQSEELQAANERLIEQKEELERTTRQAERAAAQLASANRHKSDFLANMSHELRTPLNSLLILAKDLADNAAGDLGEDQVESARVIHDSGRHLLGLINDILDLSKVEAGKLKLKPEAVEVAEVLETVRRRFAPQAREKGIALDLEFAPDIPAGGWTDRGKLEQILQNLVSNGLKYTERGGVRIEASPEPERAGAGTWVSIAVSDTGPGIAPEDRAAIFEAFEQADGSRAGTRGGTGLGLTIARRFARLLGGDLELASEPGKGSTFTLHLPLREAPEPVESPPAAAPPMLPAVASALPAEGLNRTIVVIEDDPDFAAVLCRHARERGFACLVAHNGDAGIETVRRERPAGVLLDLGLPDIDGWRVMEALKADPATAGIPVHILAASEESERGLARGAIGFFSKPVTSEQIDDALRRIVASRMEGPERVLLVDPNEQDRTEVADLLRGRGIEGVGAASAGEALSLLERESFRGLITELELPDGDGVALLEQAAARGVRLPPVVVLADAEPDGEQALRLREFTDAVVLKSGHAGQRLLDEVVLFLHSVGRAKPVRPEKGAAREPLFRGKTVLVVDDDMRNTFALSKVLRARGLKVLMAQNGRKALKQLERNEAVDAVLMDIMMPEMDGYEATRAIRREPRWRELPIIALTAKAMRGDRERCLEAGANDYLSKPIDTDELLSRLRTWLER